MSTTPLEVACGLIRRNGRVLLARRADSGLWELPGGKREPGETLADCLVRELKEELGAEVKAGRPLGKVEHAQKGRLIVLHCFVCEISQGEPLALEHKEIKWVAPQGIKALDLCPADRALIEQLGLT